MSTPVHTINTTIQAGIETIQHNKNIISELSLQVGIIPHDAIGVFGGSAYDLIALATRGEIPSGNVRRQTSPPYIHEIIKNSPSHINDKGEVDRIGVYLNYFLPFLDKNQQTYTIENEIAI